MTKILPAKSDLALSELLDRALNKGVVLVGDVTISIADVDLIYLGVKVLLGSVETVERLRPVKEDVGQGNALSLRSH